MGSFHVGLILDNAGRFNMVLSNLANANAIFIEKHYRNKPECIGKLKTSVVKSDKLCSSDERR